MFNIKIENFEGPLDLLLYFIKRDKIDIYDIPITQITNEYISVIDEAKKLDVSIAGEFLFMASMLLRIKTQMLLPRQINDESLDIEDPRIDLVAQLLEYKKYKSIANKLKNLHFENKDSFFRSSSKVVYDQSPDVSDFLNEVTLFDMNEPGSPAASYGNAGHFSPYASLSLNRTDILADVPAMLLSSTGPLALKWNYVPKMIPWFFKFILNTLSQTSGFISAAETSLLNHKTPVVLIK